MDLNITRTLLCLAWISLCSDLKAQSAFQTPVTLDNIDNAVYAESCNSIEKSIVQLDRNDREHSVAWVLWTKETSPGHSGFNFGSGGQPGLRHLRIGFKEPIPVGAVFTRGGGRLSVLKPDASFPGDLTDESQWIEAQRIEKSEIGQDEANTEDEVLWVLPHQVNTRALRFSHEAKITDSGYAGFLGGVYVLADRFANLAPQANVSTSSNQKSAERLTDESSDKWDFWSNVSVADGQRSERVSATKPEWLILYWDQTVRLAGVASVFAGFKDAIVQTYTGPENLHPRDADENYWQTVKGFSDLQNRYPSSFGLDWLDFEKTVQTRALRVRITQAQAESTHPHVVGHTKEGKRVWIAELLALSPLKESDLMSAILPNLKITESPPITIKFKLRESGNVTLVIEDNNGKRVRNLVADTYFDSGEHTIGWDGSDDLGRDQSAASHGVYLIPNQLVKPGRYRVRGLWHKAINIKYEFGLYTSGDPPWETIDHTGGWLANHTPPQAVMFVPDAGNGKPSVLVGSYVSEGTSGLAWLDLNGKKWKGQNWVGGIYTGAPHIARDTGPNSIPGIYAYVGSSWEFKRDKKSSTSTDQIRVTGLTFNEDKLIAKHTIQTPLYQDVEARWELKIGGLAAFNGLVVASITQLNQLLFVDAKSEIVLGTASVQSPRGLGFDKQGRLLALSGSKLLRYDLGDNVTQLSSPKELISTGLDDPQGILYSHDKIYVSDHGQSHQVKVFDATGKLLGTIGHAGKPIAGAYDALHMNHPRGLSVDENDNLWVAEDDFQPKRISVWKLDGNFITAFYGPSEYGGGGSIDPQDKTRFYYNGMEFKLDWEKGNSQITSVFYRPGIGELGRAFRIGMPQNAIYIGGKRFWTNCFNSNPTGGSGTAFLYADRNGVAVPVAGMGRAAEWDALKSPDLAAAWPKAANSKDTSDSEHTAFFIWVDLNEDAQIQVGELQMKRGLSGGVTVMRDGSFVVARFTTDSSSGKALRYAPRFEKDIPRYNINKPQVLAEKTQRPPSSGGDQVLASTDGWNIFTTSIKPFDASGLSGVKNGVPLWSYPSLWPGLHASHESPIPNQTGEIIGHTRLLGDMIEPKRGIPLWFINNNTGPISVLTSDGLFVTNLFQDMRIGRPWAMPLAYRGMSLNELTPGDENFWPNVTQTADGSVYLTAGRPNCIVKVEGLQNMERIVPFHIEVTNDNLNLAREYYAAVEASRQVSEGRGVVDIELSSQAPIVDGSIDDWANAHWVDIDKRGSHAYFNSSSKPYDVTGAVAIAEGKLFAVWRTGDADLLQNSGDSRSPLFKTGGALDLMIGTDPNADPKRTVPVSGDLRLLITKVAGKTRAQIYRAVASKKVPVPFSSPGRTVIFDRVDDVSDKVQLKGKNGDYEISVPLSLIGLSPHAGTNTQGDIGILRGDGHSTSQRVYWANKATAIVADIPSEAELRPNLWGRWEYKAAK